METLLQKLKDSLATTLVHFYPLAGRLSTLTTDHPRRSYSVFVDCNNSPGAGFIHAKSELTVSDIVESTYVPLVVQSLFDHHKAANLRWSEHQSLISQELVDGVFIGLSMNHAVGDGRSFWNFFNSWSNIFNSQEEDETKDLFCLKNPPIFNEVSGPLCRLPYSPLGKYISQSESPVLKERMFHFSSETVRSLKSKANQDCRTTTRMISSLQSLTAVLWRSVTRARRLLNDQETTCRFAADNRTRMDPPLPTNRFGDYVSSAITTAKTGELLENGLGWTASRLHQAVTELSGEKMASEIERLLKSQPGTLIPPNVVHVRSSPRFDKYGCQFGMGKAVAVRSGYNSKYDGKVAAYPGREGGGSIELEVCLLPEFMEALETDHEFMSLVSSSS